MIKEEYIQWKKAWLSNYIKQYRESDSKGRKVIRDNIYKNINFTEKEKDKIFESITKKVIEKNS